MSTGVQPEQIKGHKELLGEARKTTTLHEMTVYKQNMIEIRIKYNENNNKREHTHGHRALYCIVQISAVSWVERKGMQT